MKTAHDFVLQAAEYVGGDRARTHGDKGRNFHTTAILWNAYLAARRMTGKPDDLDGVDFAQMMVLAKMSRVLTGEYNPDDFVDQAGYSGCAGEVATQMHLAQEWAQAESNRT
jgi:hypothetical protein